MASKTKSEPSRDWWPIFVTVSTTTFLCKIMPLLKLTLKYLGPLVFTNTSSFLMTVLYFVLDCTLFEALFIVILNFARNALVLKSWFFLL